MLPPQKFDLVVIGSGPAGEKGAVQAAYFGKRVCVIEKAPAVGGACVHTGTLPSKTLREAALYVTGYKRRELYGMTLELDREASVKQLMGRLHAVTKQQVTQISENLRRHEITTVLGDATFISPHEVQVRCPGSEDLRLRADVFLVATGSAPHRPAGVPFTDPDVEDSDTVLDLDRIPSHLAVIGGGVIGCEYACFFAALGTHITIIEGRGGLLGGIDPELTAILRASLERGGNEIRLGDSVDAVERIPGGPLRLRLKSGATLDVDKILYSAGRVGNTKGLGLDVAGVAADDRGRVTVNPHFQTSVPHIYAAGDVVGAPALASVSMEQGRVGVCHAFGFEYKKQVSALTPYGIYTIPEISMIGSTAEDLIKKGEDVEVGRAWFRDNARGQIIGDDDGLCKLVFEAKTHKLRGVHIIGERATDLIHIGQMVMELGGTIDTFIDCVFNFPTLSESYKYAAYDGLGRLRRRTVAGLTGGVAS